MKRGENRLDEPIELIGLEIPTLTYVVIFEQLVGGDIVAEVRPVGADGRAILNHPAMELWMGARVTVQMRDGLIVREETEEGSVRGQELFRSRIEWEWDPTPETVFRYSARIPGARITSHEAPFRVVDYLILVPNPKVASSEVIASIANRVWEETDPGQLASVLDTYADRLTYYIHTSWNVTGAE